MKRIFIILILSLQVPLFATKFYVENNGNDELSGTSEANAWETISKVNSSSFNAGDTICFNKGDRWEETLIPPSSGSAINYIVYTSYGTGAKPKIYGSYAQNSFTVHPNHANIYRCDDELTTNPYAYDESGYAGGIWFSIDDSITWGDNYASSLSDLDEDYKWYWQNDTVYFYYSGSISDIDTVECTQRSRGVNIGVEYIEFNGLELKFFGSRGFGESIYPETYLRGLIIRNCNIAYSATRNGLVGYGIACWHSNALYEFNDIHDNGRRNISLNIVATAGTCTMMDVIVQNNTIYNGWHTQGIDVAVQGSNHTVKRITVRKNLIYDNIGYNKDTYSPAMNFFENNGDAGVDIDSVFFYNNIVRNCNGPGLMLNGIGDAFIINNTFTGNLYTGAAASGFIYHGGSLTSNSTIMNNIFFNYSDRADNLYMSIRFAASSGTTIDTLDYNLYYTLDNDNYILSNLEGNNYTQSQFPTVQGLGYETHSPDPGPVFFVDSLYDVSLKEGSPAISAGKAISWITDDIDGNTRDINNWTIGAKQYGTTGNNVVTKNALTSKGYVMRNGKKYKMVRRFIQ